MINRDDVLAARETIGGDLHRTPVFTSATLGPRVFLKAELFQRTGSFKPRGVLNKLRSLTDEERAQGVIAASAGNHAQALAYCAGLEGLDALIVMWSTASQAKIEATRAYGAAVDLEVSTPDTVFERLSRLQEETGRTLVHPFDDPLVIAGQGTVGLEIEEDVPDVDVVLVPVGGGGLVAGIATALPNTRVVGVEPSSSTALTAGLAAGESTPVAARSIADGLNAPFAGEHPIRIAKARALDVVLVEDDEIEDAMRFLYQRAKLACEPAGAAAVAALRAAKVPLQGGETVVAVVTGGNVSGETAAAILARP
ncbi:MAG: threonine/serine dehydratase [Gaiellaceae bacterium]